jgi:predicted RNase H-like HicB family nuclease
MTQGIGPGMELTAKVHLESGSYWAEVQELPGCFAAGNTLDELLESLREGVDLCLDQESGAPGRQGDLHIVSATLTDTALA